MNEIAFINGYIEKLAVSPSAKIMGVLSPYFDDMPALIKQLKKLGLEDIVSSGGRYKENWRTLRHYSVPKEIRTDTVEGLADMQNRIKDFLHKSNKPDKLMQIATDPTKGTATQSYAYNKATDIKNALDTKGKDKVIPTSPSASVLDSDLYKQLLEVYNEQVPIEYLEKLEQTQKELIKPTRQEAILNHLSKLKKGPPQEVLVGGEITSNGEDVANSIYKGLSENPLQNFVDMVKKDTPVFHSGYRDVAAGYANDYLIKGDVPKISKDIDKELLFTPHLAKTDDAERLALKEKGESVWKNINSSKDYVGNKSNYETVISAKSPMDAFSLYSINKGEHATNNIFPLLNDAGNPTNIEETLKSVLGKKWERKLQGSAGPLPNVSNIIMDDGKINQALYSLNNHSLEGTKYLGWGDADLPFPNQHATLPTASPNVQPFYKYYQEIRKGVKRPKVQLEAVDLMPELSNMDLKKMKKDKIKIKETVRPRINTPISTDDVDFPFRRRELLNQVKKYRETGEL